MVQPEIIFDFVSFLGKVFDFGTLIFIASTFFVIHLHDFRRPPVNKGWRLKRGTD